jgi:hypothetical protein
VVTELRELMEEALGLCLSMDLLCPLLALVGVVEGNPMRVTLWTGANSPYLGMHWKYLGKRNRNSVNLKPHCVGHTVWE